jgi:ABC-type glycerol-3-phosphate transport system permease component
MALNTAPIYSGVGDIQWGATALVAANTTYEATGSNVLTVFSSSISGSFIQRVRFKASGSTVATVARLFINNGGAISTTANNILFDEITLPATTSGSTAATAVFELPFNVALPSAYRILATTATAQVNGGWYVSAVGGSYTTP